MPALSQTFQIAIFDEFLDSFARIPRSQQKKVTKFMRRFKANPTDPSINYEKISSFADPNLRTVRIDQAYRAVVLKPDQGNVYVLLWVDNHDEAMDWARNKRVRIHPATGSLQVLTGAVGAPRTSELPEVPPAQVPQEGPSDEAPIADAPGADVVPDELPDPLFARFSDEELTSVGLPGEHLDAVRALHTGEDLDRLQASLPREAWESLFLLSAGEPLADVQDSLRPDKAVDTDDFAAALDNEASQERFAFVTSDAELEAMLEAPLEKWRIFLHRSQKKLVTAHFNGPARVLGGAGTGKTVVAMHRARYLAENVFHKDTDRLLFTTFTHNLAKDIQSSLDQLCAPDVKARIHVVHLDKWVAEFLRNNGYNYKIEYWGSRGALREHWDKAMTLATTEHPASFYREEWDYVVQPHGCTSWEDYKRASRRGRGVRLSRGQRKQVWRVFEAYRDALEGSRLRESIDAMRDARNLIKTGRARAPYVAALVDESQDMSTVAFELMREMIPEQPNDLFIVGDGHQRIYRHKVVLSHAGVHIVGRSKKLYLNYRTTDEIRAFAVSKLRDVEIDDLDGGVDSNSKYKSLMHGEAPAVVFADTFEDEVQAIRDFIHGGEARKTCLVARTHAAADRYRRALRDLGIETYRLRRSEAEDRETDGVRIATMHRVKGLEFDRMIVAGCNDGVVPLAIGEMSSEDGAVRAEAEKRERALFYVAVTRAKRAVLISGFGRRSGWV